MSPRLLDLLHAGPPHPLAVAERLIAALEDLRDGEPVALTIGVTTTPLTFGSHEALRGPRQTFAVGRRQGRVHRTTRGLETMLRRDPRLPRTLRAYWSGMAHGVALDEAYHTLRARGRELTSAVRRLAPLRTITQIDEHLATRIVDSLDLAWAAWYRAERDEYVLRCHAGPNRGDAQPIVRAMLIDPALPMGRPPLVLHGEPELALLLPGMTRVVVPMDDGATRTGLLLLGDRKNGTPWSDDALEMVRALSTLIATITGHAVEIAGLGQTATTDPLTGLYNRRHYNRTMEQELQRHLRRQDPLSLLVLDLDRFKSVNDTYGHEAGDKVLISVAKTVKDALRTPDSACRLGGEEFSVILPHTDLPGAMQVAERIRVAIERHPIRINEHTALNVTASLGVVTSPLHGRKREVLEAAADAALYAAKEAGRNQVRIGAEPTTPPGTGH